MNLIALFNSRLVSPRLLGSSQATQLMLGFFNSLFLGGFSETSAPAYGARRKGKEKALFEEDDEWAGEDIELQFDDPNITRAAFE